MRTKSEILGKYSELEFLLKCNLSFKFFAENMLKITSDGREIKIPAFQEKWVRMAEQYDRIVIKAPTGFAKTEIMGSMYPLWLLFKKRNLRVLLVSKRLDQAKGNMLERMKIYIRENEILKEMLIPTDPDVTYNKEEIRTKNGHWVKVVPYTDAIRSYRADIIVCDEIDSYEDTNIFFEHVTSRLLEGGKLICTSTPVGPTRLIAILEDKDRAGQLMPKYYFDKTQALIKPDGSPAYNKAPEAVNYEDLKDCVSAWPEAYSTKTILNKWFEQGKWNFMANNMAEVLGSAEDAIFPINYIMKSFDRTLDFTDEVNENAEYFIGADFAISDGPKADFDVFTVVEKYKGRYYVRSIEHYKGKDIPFKVRRLVTLFNRYNETEYGCTLAVDISNFGKEIERQILAEGIPVVPKNFHSAARKNLLTSLAQILKSGTLVIPRKPVPEYRNTIDCVEYGNILKQQLGGFVRVKSSKTGAETMDSTAPHDDMAISLALAISEAIGHEEMDEEGPMYGMQNI